jgi:lipopolysaccharide export system permease protein
MLKITDRYIISHFFKYYFFIQLSIALICVVINFSEILDDVIDNNVPLSELFSVYYYNFIIFFVFLLNPISVLLTVILFTTGFTRNNEIIALLSSGISYYRLLVPYIGVAWVITGVCLLGGFYWVPDAVKARVDFEYQYLKNRNLFGQYHIHRKIDAHSYAYLYTYDQYRKEGEYFSLRYYSPSARNPDHELQSKSARYDSTRGVWVLQQVRHRIIEPQRETIRQLAQLDTHLLFTPDDIFKRDAFMESRTRPELLADIELEKLRGSVLLNDYERELATRWALPFATIILTIIGFSISTTKVRGGVAFNLVLGFISCLAYIIILKISQIFISDLVSVALSIWIPNIVFSFVALIFLLAAKK